MKFNGIMIIILLVFLLFLINAVSAADANVTVESECSVSILDDSNYDDAVEKLGIAGEDVLGKTIKTPGSTFSDIQTKIDSAKNGDVIRLTGKTYSATDNEGISISKRITIQGASNEVVLDAKHLSDEIIYSSNSVTFKNIKFINANKMAIDACCGCTLINCTFEGNNNYGAYILDIVSNPKVTIENCTFKNNGLGLFIQNTDSTIINCEFDNNINTGFGGAIEVSNSTLNIFSSKFTNNQGSEGGAIYISDSVQNSVISDSLFINNHADWGSAIYDGGSTDCTLENNVFINNKAYDSIEGIYFLFYISLLKNNVIKNDVNINANAKVSIVPTGNNYGDLVEVKFTGANYVPLPNKKVTLMVYENGISQNLYSATTDSRGIAQFSPVNSAENYDFIAIADAGNFKVVSSLNNIQFYKTNALIKANNVVTTYKSGKQFTAQILNKNTNKGVAGVKISVIATGNGFESYDCVSNMHGKVSIDLSKLPVGKWTVEVSPYYGDENINLAEVKCSFKINKAPTKVKAPKVTNKYKKSKYFKVTVKAYNKPLKNVKVKVKVFTGKKSKIYKIKTNKKGVAKLNTKKLSKGNHKVIISSGNNNYKISAKSKITIK